jgi:metacaspase-1
MPSTIKKALLIGINYKNTANELRGCINDVIAIKTVLSSSYGYEEKNILLLTDETHIKPTAANILEGFKWLISLNPAADFGSKYTPIAESEKASLFLHYSGHGAQVRDTNGDEADGKDETLCPLDFNTAGFITDDVVRAELAVKVPKGSKLTAIVDACHSESSFDLTWTVKTSLLNSYNIAKVGNYTPPNGEVILLSGCRDEQTSADIMRNGKGQGALTYAVLSVLEKSKYKITCDKLLEGVRDFIKKNNLSSQIPCLSFGKTADISQGFKP